MTSVGGVRQSNLVTGIAFKSDASTVIAEVETKYEDHRNLLDYIENRWVAGGTPSVVSKYDVTNDVLGRRSNTAYSGSAFAASFNQSYGHNARNELTSSLRSDTGSWDYDYDNIGNRLSSSADGNSVSYVSNRLNQYLRKGGGGGLRYDADGNLTSIGSAADLDDDGDVDVNDFVVFEQQITGPTSVPAGTPMAMGMEQAFAPMAMMAAPAASESGESIVEQASPEPWNEEESTAVLKVKALSGGPALTTLEPNTTYQLRYRAGVNQVNGFMVSVFADSAGQGISGATAPSGDWGGADVFEFIDMASASAGVLYDADDRAMRQMVHGFWFPDSENTGSAGESAGRRGQLFEFTTGSAGTIHFELFMDWIDFESREGVWMRTDLTVEVVDPGSTAAGGSADNVSSQSAVAAAGGPSNMTVFDADPAKSTGFNGQLGSALAALLMATGGTGGPEFALADLDGDGDSDLADFAMFQEAFGDTGGTRYTWNAENRLTGVEPMAPKNGDKKLQFAYDHMGKRVLKQVWTYTAGSWGSPIAETKYVYDGWRVIMELDGLNNDAVIRKFTWGLDLSRSVEGAGGIGGLLATEDTAGTTATASDDRTFIYFYEPNGNVGQLVETTTGTNYGTIAVRYEYDPYGKRINPAAIGEYDQPYRFSTKPVDDETGLGYWGYRYYSYDLGRWVNRDPIGERGGLNLYGALKNSSVDYIDRDGATAKKPVEPESNAGDSEPEIDPPTKQKETAPATSSQTGRPSFWNPCGCRVHRQEIRIGKLKDAKDPTIGNQAYEEFIGHTWIDCTGSLYDYPENFQDDRKEKSEWIWGTTRAIFGTIKAGSGAGKKCRCATCDDIKSCLQAVETIHASCSYSEAGLGIFPPPTGKMNCRYHVIKSLSSCCLIKNMLPDRAFDIGPNETRVGGEK